MKRETKSKPTKVNPFKNKWFIAFTVAAVLAVAAIIVAIVIVVNRNGDTPQGGYVEGSDIYYYDTAEGEWVLTLYEDGNFTLASFTATKTGTYIQKGDDLTLDFIKDSDGTAIATVSGDKITLFYDGATLPFIPRINYTVTYSGTDMPNTAVVNGKTLTKPNVDPVKEGYKFFGWYKDEALTVPFDFDTTIVTSDITIYAKWVPAELFN